MGRLFAGFAVVVGLVASTGVAAATSPTPVVGPPSQVAAAPLLTEHEVVAWDATPVGTLTAVAWVGGPSGQDGTRLQYVTGAGALQGEPIALDVDCDGFCADDRLAVAVAASADTVTVTNVHTASTSVDDRSHTAVRAWLVKGTKVTRFDWTVCGDSPHLRSDVAWNGTMFLVSVICDDHRLRSRTLSPSGALGAVKTVTGPVGYDYVLAGNDTGFGVASTAVTGGPGIAIHKLTAAGAANGGQVIVASGAGNPRTPTLATRGTAGVVAYTLDSGKIAARTLTRLGSPSAQKLVTNSPATDLDPHVAPGPNNTWLIAWRDSTAVVRATVLSATGTATPPNGTIVDTQGFTAPVLSSGPSGPRAIVHIRIGSDSQNELSTLPLTATGAAEGPPVTTARRFAPQSCASIERGNGNFLAVWSETRTGFDGDVYAQRLTPSGARTGQVIRLTNNARSQSCPRAAWGGDRWLVTWTDQRAVADGGDQIYGAMVTGTGTVTPTNGFPISTGDRARFGAEVTFDGTVFVVAWTDTRNGTDTNDVYLARVRKDRTVIDTAGKPVTTAPGRQSGISIAGLAGSTVIAWHNDNGPALERIFRNGAFVTPARTLAPYSAALDTVATGSQLVTMWANNGRLEFHSINPANGTIAATTTDPSMTDVGNLHLAYDGTRIVAYAHSITLTPYGTIGSQQGDLWTLSTAGTRSASNAPVTFIPDGLAALPTGPAMATIPTAIGQHVIPMS